MFNIYRLSIVDEGAPLVFYIFLLCLELNFNPVINYHEGVSGFP
jgi:hypothetical protein